MDSDRDDISGLLPREEVDVLILDIDTDLDDIAPRSPTASDLALLDSDNDDDPSPVMKAALAPPTAPTMQASTKPPPDTTPSSGNQDKMDVSEPITLNPPNDNSKDQGEAGPGANQEGSSGMASASPKSSLKNPQQEQQEAKGSTKRKAQRNRIRIRHVKNVRKAHFKGDPDLKKIIYVGAEESQLVNRHPDEPKTREQASVTIGQRRISDSEDDDIRMHIEVETDTSDSDAGRPWRRPKVNRGPGTPHDPEGQGEPKRKETQPVEPPIIVRHSDIHFISPSRKMGLNIVTTQWELLDRYHRMHDPRNPVPRKPLAKTLLAELQDMLKAGYFGNRTEDFHDWTRPLGPGGMKERQDTVKKFLQVVEETALVCFNTEAHVPGLNRVMLSLGNLAGTVILFCDARELPTAIKNMLEDFSITKIGNGIATDFDELKASEIRINNWADTGCLRIALFPPAWEDPNPRTPEDDITDRTKATKRINDRMKRMTDLEKRGYKKQKAINEELHKLRTMPRIAVLNAKMKYSISTLVHDLKMAKLMPSDYERTAFDFLWHPTELFKKGTYPWKMKAPHHRERPRAIGLPCGSRDSLRHEARLGSLQGTGSAHHARGR